MKRSFRFAVVVSRFNSEITEAMLASCVKRLGKAGVRPADLEVARVPGAFEIPWAADRLAATGRFDAVITLGCVVRGRTPQNDYISRCVFQHLQRVSLKRGVPCILGVITPNTWAQALARTKGKLDRGLEYAEAALEMAELRRALEGKHGKA